MSGFRPSRTSRWIPRMSVDWGGAEERSTAKVIRAPRCRHDGSRITVTLNLTKAAIERIARIDAHRSAQGATRRA